MNLIALRVKAAIAGSVLLSCIAQPVQAAPGPLTPACEPDAGSGTAYDDARQAMAKAQRPASTARRKKRTQRAQRECDALEAAISDNERIEQGSGARGPMEALYQDTLGLRQRQRELGCSRRC